jgi:hypothetical protein
VVAGLDFDDAVAAHGLDKILSDHSVVCSIQ